MSKFYKDRKIGINKEMEIAQYLVDTGFVARKSSSLGHDLDIWGDGEPVTKLEIKFDQKYSITGKLAVEFYNHKQGRSSGIQNSKADIWVYYISEQEIMAIPSQVLKSLVLMYQDHIVSGGDQNSNLVLIPFKKVQECFLNLKQSSKKEIQNLFKMGRKLNFNSRSREKKSSQH